MKGYGSGGVSAAAQQAAKRRWKGKAAAVFGLFIFSLLVPLAFLLGLHNSFPSGYMADDRSQQESSFETYSNVDRGRERFPSEGDQQKLPNHKDKFAPAIPKTGVEDRKQSPDTGLSAYEIDISCEHEFGSYCLWSRKHREVMKDSIVKRLKDQLFVARAYYPSIAKIQGKETLARELKINILDHERMLSEAVSDPDLPPLLHWVSLYLQTLRSCVRCGEWLGHWPLAIGAMCWSKLCWST